MIQNIKTSTPIEMSADLTSLEPFTNKSTPHNITKKPLQTIVIVGKNINEKEHFEVYDRKNMALKETNESSVRTIFKNKQNKNLKNNESTAAEDEFGNRDQNSTLIDNDESIGKNLKPLIKKDEFENEKTQHYNDLKEVGDKKKEQENLFESYDQVILKAEDQKNNDEASDDATADSKLTKMTKQWKIKMEDSKVNGTTQNVDAMTMKGNPGNGLVGVIATNQKSKKATPKLFGTIAINVTKLPEKVLYARNNRGILYGSRVPVTGGEPINEELAMELRTVAFGSCGCPPRGEWIRTSLCLRPANQPLAYGLNAPRNGCRGLLAALGAHVLKHLLFGAERPRDAQGKLLQTDALLKPDEIRQQDALAFAISEVIWRASGDTKKAAVVIPQDIVYVQHSHSYYQDSVTEKLHIFEFHNLEDLQIFIKSYIYMFDEEPGCGTLLLLYSCMLSRGLQNIKKDLDSKTGYLVSSQLEGSINVVMLLLTGRATPYLHNGVIYVGDEDHYALPQYGILARSSVGFLEWRGNDEQKDSDRQPPGSRLKTPALPIWVSFYAGHYGMLFNTNRELLRNYHAERRFDLHYYTCGGLFVLLSVDTRALNDGGTSTKDDINATPLEKLIHTKWQDAKVTWNGPTPYVGETSGNN